MAGDLCRVWPLSLGELPGDNTQGLFDRELFLGDMVSLLRRSRVGHHDQEGRQKCSMTRCGCREIKRPALSEYEKY